jgi:hypothetical protein
MIFKNKVFAYKFSFLLKRISLFKDFQDFLKILFKFKIIKSIIMRISHTKKKYVCQFLNHLSDCYSFQKRKSVCLNFLDSKDNYYLNKKIQRC